MHAFSKLRTDEDQANPIVNHRTPLGILPRGFESQDQNRDHHEGPQESIDENILRWSQPDRLHCLSSEWQF